MSRLRRSDAERRLANDFGPDFSEALARGLTIITAFDTERRQMTISDVSRIVDLPRATVRRALHTLTRLGYVETDGRLFRLTPRIMKLTAAYLASNPLSTIVQPTCEQICRRVDESCTVAVLDEEDAIVVARASPWRPTSAGFGIGYRLPAFCSALGRTLLAALPDKRLDMFLTHLNPVPRTIHTKLDKAVLRDLIITARSQGFALVDQEVLIGFRSVAVPIVRYDGTTSGAINIGAPIERVSVDTMLEVYLPILKEAAKDLKGQLI